MSISAGLSWFDELTRGLGRASQPRPRRRDDGPQRGVRRQSLADIPTGEDLFRYSILGRSRRYNVRDVVEYAKRCVEEAPCAFLRSVPAKSASAP